MHHKPKTCAAIGLLGALLCSAANADPAPESTPIEKRIRCGDARSAVFRIDNPDARSSTATLVDPVVQHKPAAAIGEWTVTNRVVVRTDNPDLLHGLDARPAAGAPGFWIVTTPTVRCAIDCADQLLAADADLDAYPDIKQPHTLRTMPTDPLFGLQWHLHNTQLPAADVNIVPAWALGYTGAGVTIGIVEYGWQTTHPDLDDNFDASASQPGGSIDAHATSCAGVAAAEANNGIGGAGAAFGAGISSQIFGTPSKNADAFAFRNDLNDIKSNSWGPSDNGRMWTMTSIERAAIEDAVRTGRDGKGLILTWAAGNGGTGDRIDYDPYASSRYVIAVGSIGDEDRRAFYNERGSSHFVVAPSSGNARNIYTTDAGGGYTPGFGGTSAAAPLGAGVIALMLEANANLTWRDVQHILADTARWCHPSDWRWTFNGAGRAVNENYGFGAIDAHAAVLAAETWTNVAPEVCIDSGVVTMDTPIPNNDPGGITSQVTINDAIGIEAVELILNVDTTYAGDLRITLVSPHGTESIFATPRSDPTQNLADYILTSNRHWGENSTGTWTVFIADERTGDAAHWVDFRLKLYGTRACRADMNADGVADGVDIGLFLKAYVAGDPAADANADGVIDGIDVGFFLHGYAQGC